MLTRFDAAALTARLLTPCEIRHYYAIDFRCCRFAYVLPPAITAIISICCRRFRYAASAIRHIYASFIDKIRFAAYFATPPLMPSF